MTQTIEQLTARVRELEEENARLNGVIESNIDDGIDKIMAMSDEQVSALAGFEGSNPEDKATIARQCMDIARLRAELAALHELIEKVEKMTIERCAEWMAESAYKDGATLSVEICVLDDEPVGDFTDRIKEAIRALPTGQIKLEELL